jgi:hypothetical protein
MSLCATILVHVAEPVRHKLPVYNVLLGRCHVRHLCYEYFVTKCKQTKLVYVFLNIKRIMLSLSRSRIGVDSGFGGFCEQNSRLLF